MDCVKFTLQPGEEISFEVIERVFQTKTETQKIEIVRTKTHGLMLFVDDKPQSSQLDHFIFNETMVHSAMVHVHQPKRVFLAGGGPGSGLFEILKYSTVEEVVICDIDPAANKAYQKILLDWHRNSFNDSRVKRLYQDAFLTLESVVPESFDVIIIDVPDPLEGSPAQSLFTTEFFLHCQRALRPEGVLITQAGRTVLNNFGYHASVLKTVDYVFGNASSMSLYYPCYMETWGFVLAGCRHHLKPMEADEFDDRLRQNRITDLKFLNGEIYKSLFAKPNYFEALLSQEGRVHFQSNLLVIK